MSTHAKLSPSSRHRWAKCPGSVREETKYPNDAAGPAALDGTRSHALLEYCLQTKTDPMTLVGHVLLHDMGDFIIDQSRADRVHVAWEYVQGLTYYTEDRVDPSNLLGRDDMGGTVDIIVMCDDVLEIIDYKDGMHPVSAVDNAQMDQYAYGVLSKWTTPAKTIRMTIIQPKLAIRGLPVISSHDVDKEDFLARKNIIIAQVAATDDPDAPLIPGEEQCRYCRAKGSCTALVNKSLVALDVSPLDIAQQSANKDPTTMDNEQLAKLLEAAPLIRSMLDSAQDEVLKRLESGQRVDGFKLVNGRGSRQWALSDTDMADRLQKMGVPKTAVYKTEVVSVAQAEKLTWTKKKNGEEVRQGLTPRQLKTMQEEYVITKAGKITVAPESDPRKAITVDVSSLFSQIETEPKLPNWLIGE